MNKSALNKTNVYFEDDEKHGVDFKGEIMTFILLLLKLKSEKNGNLKLIHTAMAAAIF